MGQPASKEGGEWSEGDDSGLSPAEQAQQKTLQTLINTDSNKLQDLNKQAHEVLKHARESMERGEEGGLELKCMRMALKKIPEYLFVLSYVKILNLSFNRLQSLPAELGNLKHLTTLDVSHNLLHFTLDVHSRTFENEISVLSKFPDLTHLNLSWNFVPSVVCVSKITSLTHLDLHHNGNLTLLPALDALRSLTFLDVSECYLSKLPNLAALPLRKLLAIRNQLDSLPKLPETLTLVHVPYNKIWSVENVFGGCVNLEYLDLRSNHLTLNSKFSDFVNMTKLTRLELGPNKISSFPDVFCHITSLASLDFSGMAIECLPASLAALAPTLRRLILRYNKFFEIPAVVFQLTGLTDLDVAGSELKIVSQDISKLVSLHYVNLTYNKLKELPVELGQITTLRYLYVDENPFSDKTLVKLADSTDFAKLIDYIKSGGSINEETVPTHFDDEEEYPSTLSRAHNKRSPSPDVVVPEGATSLSRVELRNKIMGLFFGAAVGDALGLATEFLNREQASFQYGREPVNFDRSIFNPDRHRSRWAPGDWTDDTDQMLLILENLLDHNGALDVNAFALALSRWAYGGFHEFGDSGGMGLGQTVSKVLSHHSFLDDSHKCATEVWESTGRVIAANGAVMRTSILGVPNFHDIPKVISNTLAICKVTHADPRCQASCIAVTVAIALMLRGIDNVELITKRALEEAQQVITQPSHREELNQYIRYGIKELDLSDRPAIGYTYKTMGSGFYALRESNFANALMRVMWESGDADTNGAVAGAMLGCKLGYNKIPKRWVDNLLHKEWLHEKLEDFLEMLGLPSE